MFDSQYTTTDYIVVNNDNVKLVKVMSSLNFHAKLRDGNVYTRKIENSSYLTFSSPQQKQQPPQPSLHWQLYLSPEEH